MLERWISETKERQSKRAISQEQYNKWRRNTVTIRMFEDLELMVLDSFQEYQLPDDPNVAFGMAKKREGATEQVEIVLDWSPAGVEGPNDEEDN